MDSIYYDPIHPASFGGVHRLKRASGSKNAGEWLSSQPTYTLHKPVRHKFPRLQTYVSAKGEQYQADLVDVTSLAKYNNGYKFLLTCIDVLSRYAWVVPLKNKKGQEVVRGLKRIFKDGVPMKLQTDQGKEFLNRLVQNYLRKKKVKYFFTNSEKKAALCERFNRTLKGKTWRYMTYKNTHKYIDVLDKIVAGYNATVHSTTKMAPKDVDINNEHIVWMRLYGNRSDINPRYKVGDTVRISRQKGTFEKGFTQNWSEEIFKISRVNTRDVPTYILVDANGDEIQGRFYEQEIQKVKDPGIYVIEKILKRQKGKVLVKWRGYPESMSSWIPASELKWITSI